MKKPTRFLFLIIPLFFYVNLTLAQCTPGDEESCPDPENNGQICPDSVAPVIIGVDYHQEITMLPPSEIDTLNITAELYYIKLVSIEGLPDGIDWVTNTDDNIFEAGTYYCILFSGNSTADEGTYPIKIEVDLYVKFFGDTLEVPGLVDSTSISMQVMQPNAVGENGSFDFVTNVWPNPFQDELNIELVSSPNNPVELRIYNMLGQTVYNKIYSTASTDGILRIDAAFLPEGMYFVAIKNNNEQYTRLISRSR